MQTDATVELELLAALVVALERRVPGLLHQMMVLLDDEPRTWAENVTPLHPPPPPRPTRVQAYEWAERAAGLLRADNDLEG